MYANIHDFLLIPLKGLKKNILKNKQFSAPIIIH